LLLGRRPSSRAKSLSIGFLAHVDLPFSNSIVERANADKPFLSIIETVI
jgi:hypothetical protein